METAPLQPAAPQRRRRFQFRLRTIFVVVTIVAVVCAVVVRRLKQPTPAEQPSWFPLGGEVYQESDRSEAERSILQFQKEPRWFLGFSKAVSKEQFDDWRKRQGLSSQLQGANDLPYRIPSPPPYPKQIEDIPLTDQGASLRLSVEPAKEADELTFSLTLAAGGRAIRREVEHRSTNTLPFLFAFLANGKAIACDLDHCESIGGLNELIELVPAKGDKKWHLRVAKQSLAAIVPAKAQELAIVAAFSERQHEGYFTDGTSRLENENSDFNDPPPQILVRSDAVRLRRTSDGWNVVEDR